MSLDIKHRVMIIRIESPDVVAIEVLASGIRKREIHLN